VSPTDDALYTDAWLASCNEALSDAGRHEGRALVVTELVTDAPASAHAAITLVADDEGVRLVAGEHPAATAWLTITMRDAAALHEGSLDPAAALAEGRVKVRGDLRAVVDAASLLADAHARLRAR